MAYIVSARKYRPKTFDEVVGQQAVTNILKKAIEKKRLAQALLFTGPRGVGKTSCARIMAREVNKEFLEDPEQDLSFNIFELDAASNNSVDDIRELIDQVRIPPQTGKYKVYIIDEVHMLSMQAFNAFLKTLEEPPEHAIFILATTEKHKIPATILSRCQIFDFKRISVTDIKEHLKKIAEKEGIDADEDALYLIARQADGALRDALSAFDKIVSLADEKITRSLVAEHLGILDFDVYFDITRFIHEGDAAGLLEYFNRLVANGMDIYRFIGGLTSHFRDLLMAKNPVTLSYLEQSDEIKEKYREQSQWFDEASLTRAIDLLVQADVNYKISQNPQLLTELTLLKVLSVLAGGKKKNELTSEEAPVSLPSVAILKKETENPQPAAGRVQPEIKSDNSRAESQPEKSADGQAEMTSASQKNVEKEQVKEEGAYTTLGLGVIKKARKRANVREDEAFTPEDVEKLWKEYVEHLFQQGEKTLHNAMQSVKPEVNGKTVLLTFNHPYYEQQFKLHAEKVLRFLRDRLHNHYVEFDIRLEELPEEKDKELLYYTREQKIKRLAELNPHIKELIKKLHLE